MKGIARAFIVALVLPGCALFEHAAVAPEPEAEARPAPIEVTAVEPQPKPVAAPKPAEPLARTPSDLDILVSEFQRLRRLPSGEVAREQEAARQAFVQSRSDAARVRWAMTLALPGAASNEQAALELLDPVVKNQSSPLHGFAFLLASYIQEQRRLAAQVHGLQHNVQSLQQNVAALQQKLDALKTLERSLTERGGRR